ncbi:unnamed protein product [Cyprideis torosa]|uniref:gamma-glutamylcyclotransferase n=1 Tax=Cyprideis torosa TaxID=163714 RepID=A0A7R8W6Q7_9CRUS|nr:unnamed protein product [Cyprideis torosa]CAG0886710.1 unnamed protein product [Cyprideis torosa]
MSIKALTLDRPDGVRRRGKKAGGGKRSATPHSINLNRSLTSIHDLKDGKTTRKYFYFFTFGPYMNPSRLKGVFPDATQVGIGRLPHYRLSFGYVCPLWRGGVPTPVYDSSPNEEVWGVIYQIKERDRALLYHKEGVDFGIYEPFTAVIHLPNDTRKPPVGCTTFKIKPPFPYRPDELKPSGTLKRYLIEAARFQKLPNFYIDNVLEPTEDNGYYGPVEAIESSCELPLQLEEYSSSSSEPPAAGPRDIVPADTAEARILLQASSSDEQSPSNSSDSKSSSADSTKPPPLMSPALKMPANFSLFPPVTPPATKGLSFATVNQVLVPATSVFEPRHTSFQLVTFPAPKAYPLIRPSPRRDDNGVMSSNLEVTFYA